MIQVAWSADPRVQQTVELLGESGMRLVCGDFGFRAMSDPAPSVDRLVDALVRGGFRLGLQPLCVECGRPAEQVCQECVEGSGPSDRVGEDGERVRGRRPGHLSVVAE